HRHGGRRASHRRVGSRTGRGRSRAFGRPTSAARHRQGVARRTQGHPARRADLQPRRRQREGDRGAATLARGRAPRRRRGSPTLVGRRGGQGRAGGRTGSPRRGEARGREPMIYDEFPELYDAQYLSCRGDLPFYLRVADDVGGPVLELGAGTGRVTESLARAGHEVTAVDASAPMLRRARERLEASGIETGEGRQVRLVSADMRELDLERRYPLVVAPFNTLAHAYTLEDQDRVLSVVHSLLEEGGVFAFALFVPRLGQLGVLRSEPSLAEPVRESLRGSTAGRVDLFVSQRDDPERQLLE